MANTTVRRSISLVLALLMVFSMFTATVSADNENSAVILSESIGEQTELFEEPEASQEPQTIEETTPEEKAQEEPAAEKIAAEESAAEEPAAEESAAEESVPEESIPEENSAVEENLPVSDEEFVENILAEDLKEIEELENEPQQENEPQKENLPEEENAAESVTEEPAVNDDSQKEETNPENGEETAEEAIETEELLTDEIEAEGPEAVLTGDGDTVTVKGVEYTIDGMFAVVTGYDTSEESELASEVTIPSSIVIENEGITETFIVTKVYPNAFKGCEVLTSLTVSERVVTIGDGAFANCPNLTRIEFQSEYTSLGSGCFSTEAATVTSVVSEGNTSSYLLTYNWLEDNRYFYLTDTISWGYDPEESKAVFTGSGAMPDYLDYTLRLWNDLNVKAVEIQGEITTTGAYAFAYMDSLESVILSDSVTTVSAGSFWYSTNLELINDAVGVTEIEASAFAECSSLKYVYFPYLEIIGDTAFANSGIESFTVADSLDTIGSSVFFQCLSLLSFDGENDIFSVSDDGCLLCGEGWILAAAPAGLNEKYGVSEQTEASGKYNIPAGTLGIAPDAFNGCYGVTTIAVPVSVAYIESCAFANCEDLKCIKFYHGAGDALTIVSDAFTVEDKTTTVVYVPDPTNICAGIKNYKWTSANRQITYASLLNFTLDKEYILLDKEYGDKAEISAIFDDPAYFEDPDHLDQLIWECYKETDEYPLDPAGGTEIWNEDATEIIGYSYTGINPLSISIGEDAHAGSVMVVASLNAGDVGYSKLNAGAVEYSKTAHIEVMDSSVSAVESVSLPVTSATVDLYKTDFTRVEVVLNLKQYYALPMETFDAAPVDDYTKDYIEENPDKGVVITSATFTEEADNDLFYLHVVDDRYLEIIPRENTLTTSPSKIVYKPSTIKVVINENDSEPYETAEKLTLSLKYTKPAVAVTKPAVFNTFYQDPSQALIFSNGNVTKIETIEERPLPDWVELTDDPMGIMIKSEAAAASSGSGIVNLLLTVEGYSIKQEVSIPVSYKYTAPAIVSDISYLYFPESYAGIATVKLYAKDSDSSISEMGISKIELSEASAGKYTLVNNLDECSPVSSISAEAGEISYVTEDIDSGEKTALPLYITPEETYVPTGKDTVSVLVYFEGAENKPVELKFRVSVVKSVSFIADSSTSVINTCAGIMYAYFSYSPTTTANFDFTKLGELEDYVTVKYGNTDCTDCFDTYAKFRIDQEDNENKYVLDLSVSVKEENLDELKEGKYTVTCSLSKADKRLKDVTATFTLIKTKKTLSATLKKTSGTIDLTKCMTADGYNEIRYQVVYSNCAPQSNENYSFRIEQRNKTGRQVIKSDIKGEQLKYSDWSSGNSRYIDIWLDYNAVEEFDTTNYSYYLVFESDMLAKKLEAKMPVTRSVVSLSLSNKSITLNSAVCDSVTATATVSLKNYWPKNPVAEPVDDAEDYIEVSEIYTAYLNKRVCVEYVIRPTDKAREEAVTGTYYIDIKAGPFGKAVRQKVVLVSGSAENPLSKIKCTAKASGSIDVLRDGTYVTLKSTFTNLGGINSNTVPTLNVKVLNGKKYVDFDNSDGIFEYVYNDYSGTGYIYYHTWYDEDGTPVNASKYKFKVSLTTMFYDDNGEEIGSVTSNEVSMSVIMGKSQYKVSTSAVQLLTADKYDTQEFTLVPTDSALNCIESVTIAPKQKVSVNGVSLAAEKVFNVELINERGLCVVGFDPSFCEVPGKTMTASIKLNIAVRGGSGTTNATATLKVTIIPNSYECVFSEYNEDYSGAIGDTAEISRITLTKTGKDKVRFDVYVTGKHYATETFKFTASKDKTVTDKYGFEEIVESTLRSVSGKMKSDTTVLSADLTITKQLKEADYIKFRFYGSNDSTKTNGYVIEIDNLDELKSFF